MAIRVIGDDSGKESKVRKTADEFKKGSADVYDLTRLLRDPESMRIALNDRAVLVTAYQRSCLTVAHIVAQNEEAARDLLKKPDILKLADDSGGTVAHVLAQHDDAVPGLLKMPDILGLVNNEGWRVLQQLFSTHDLKTLISAVSSDISCLDEMRDRIIGLFEDIRINLKITRIGYVVGGDLYELQRHADKIKSNAPFPVFSALDISNTEAGDRKADDASLEKLRFFYNSLISSGQVTAMFMTPDWETSSHAVEMHKIGMERRLGVYYLDELSRIFSVS